MLYMTWRAKAKRFGHAHDHDRHSIFDFGVYACTGSSGVYAKPANCRRHSHIFPRSEIYTLQRLGVPTVQNRLNTLRHELEALPNTDSVSFSSQVPFEGTSFWLDVSAKPGDTAGKFRLNRLQMTPEFLATYDIPLLAGRNISRDIAGDEFREDKSEAVNVIANELTLSKLGIESPEDAINKHIFELDDGEDKLKEFVIVGVVPTQNIIGHISTDLPWVFYYHPPTLDTASIRISSDNVIETVENIETVWKRVIPDYPMQGRFLDETFNQSFRLLRILNMALSGFATIALSLSMIGLFGLAAFMAAQKTREIGIRKVLGASSGQITRLLVWQFSKPAIWALALALPAAFIASKIYLDSFPDRIESPVLVLLLAGIMSVLIAWITVAGHAFRIARANPVEALRYE